MSNPTAVTLCHCGRPVKDMARLCAGCTARFARDLGDIGALAEEAETTRLRQSKTGGQASGVLSRPYERPLPWNEKAGDAADVLRHTTVAWVRVILDERGGRMPDGTMQAMSVFLLSQLEWLRHHPNAEQAADEIHHATSEVRRIIDLAPGRLYIGPCDPAGDFGDEPCPVDLYAREGRLEVQCECGLVWNVENRRAYLLEAAQGQLATAAELSRFLSAYGEPLTFERVRQWVRRDQITAHGKNPAGQAVYLVSDAVALLARMGRGKGKAAA